MPPSGVTSRRYCVLLGRLGRLVRRLPRGLPGRISGDSYDLFFPFFVVSLWPFSRLCCQLYFRRARTTRRQCQCFLISRRLCILLICHLTPTVLIFSDLAFHIVFARMFFSLGDENAPLHNSCLVACVYLNSLKVQISISLGIHVL